SSAPPTDAKSGASHLVGGGFTRASRCSRPFPNLRSFPNLGLAWCGDLALENCGCMPAKFVWFFPLPSKWAASLSETVKHASSKDRIPRGTNMSGTNYKREIRQQPDVLRQLLEEGRGEVEALAQDIRSRTPTYGLFAARGSSDNAARYGQYVLGIHNNLTCALAAPSLFSLYQT